MRSCLVAQLYGRWQNVQPPSAAEGDVAHMSLAPAAAKKVDVAPNVRRASGERMR